jgi:small subunit ribosomal protein S16
MSVKIRLRRMGRRKAPVYALVATDARHPRDGRFIEDLGRYAPIKASAETAINTERVMYWLETGAQPSETVRSILSKEGVMLALHMKRKGASTADIEAAVATHREAVASKEGGSESDRERRRKMLAAERERVAKEEAELAKKRAEDEAKAKAEAEAAQKALAAEREAAEAAAAKAADAAAEAPEAEATEAPEAPQAEAPEADAPEAAAEEGAADEKEA